MRNTIVGAVLTIWGAAILVLKFAGGGNSQGGAYAAGQSAALAFVASVS